MNNKKSISIILGIIMVIGLGAAYFIINESAKTKPDNEYITVKYKKASVGAILTAELSDEGKKKYPQAQSYYIYGDDGMKELSIDIEKLGVESTVYPKADPGEKIVVFLYDKDRELIVKLDTKVIK